MELSKEDAWDVDKREEVFPVFDLVFRSVQSFSLLIAKDLNKARLHNFFFARSRLEPVVNSSIAAEPHATLDNHPHNLSVSIELICFGELSLEDFF